MTDKPKWLMLAELKAMNLRSDANALREQYLAIQNEISDVSIDRNKLVDQHAVYTKHREALAGLRPDDERIVQAEKKLASITAEIELLNAHIDGARARQEAIKEKSTPANILAEGATAVTRTLQGQASANSVGSI